MGRYRLLNRIINRFYAAWGAFNVAFMSALVRGALHLRNVELGKNISFYGRPICQRADQSVIKIGDDCRFRSSLRSNLIGINRPCIIATHSPGAILEIGNGSGFSGTVIGCFRKISIGANVKFGANTTVTDSDWHAEDPRSGGPEPVVIGDNVWIGVGSVILKGVEIGANTVIGAGSVVTSNIPANVIAAGNPCRVIRTIHEGF